MFVHIVYCSSFKEDDMKISSKSITIAELFNITRLNIGSGFGFTVLYVYGIFY